MPDQPNLLPVQSAWLAFVGSVRPLLGPRSDDRPLDQYLAFRDATLALVESPDFLAGLRQAWTPFDDAPREPVGKLLLLELRAFPLAIEVAQAQDKTSAAEKGWIQKWLGRASTITGSMEDIVDGLPPLVKGGLHAFREVIDLFRG